MIGYGDLLATLPGVTLRPKGYQLTLKEDEAGLSTGFEDGELAAERFSALTTLLRPAREGDLVQVELLARDDGKMSSSVSPGRNCGFVTIQTAGLTLSIEVRPKISGTNLFSLLCLGGDPEKFLRDQLATLTTTADPSLVQLLATAYGIALTQVVSRAGLRGLHEARSERLKFRTQGKIDVVGYLREFASGRPHVLPCTFPTHTLDNQINRLLCWALHTIVRACRETGSVPPTLDKLEVAFGGVTLGPPIGSSMSESLRLPNSFAHYKDTGAIDLAKLIVRSSNIGAAGGAYKTAAVTVPMHEVFEAAFARLIAGWSGSSLEGICQQEWRILAARDNTSGKGGCFVPDIVLPPCRDRLGLVADTKWKSGLDRGAYQGDLGRIFMNLRGIKLYNADIYQMLGYLEAARRIHGSDFVGVLVYPVADVHESDLAPLHLTVGNEKKPLPLFLLPWDVGAQCFNRLRSTWERIDALRKSQSSHAVDSVFSVAV